MKVEEVEKENIPSMNKLKDLNSATTKKSCHLIENEASDLLQLNFTNYNMFMTNWEKHQSFKIPDCFKLIKISDNSCKLMGNEY